MRRAVVVVALVLLVVLVCVLAAALDNAASAAVKGSAKLAQNSAMRHVTLRPSRSFPRPASLPPVSRDSGPADPAGGTQTSPKAARTPGSQLPSVTPAAVSHKEKVSAAAGPTQAQWTKLRWCESRNEYGINTGNGYYGAYQFDLSTWHSNGGVGRPDLATPAEQDRVALVLFSRRGAAPWPVCGKWLR